VDVGVAVRVSVGELLGVWVGVRVPVDVAVSVGLFVAVGVAVDDGARVGVGVLVARRAMAVSSWVGEAAIVGVSGASTSTSHAVISSRASGSIASRRLHFIP
jgi:hypothetical protein